MPARALFPDFDTSYAQLPPSFYSYVEPYGASAPSLIKLNTALAETLGCDVEAPLDDEHTAQVFSGNARPEALQPLAMAYAGHQFGGFNPGLGDGRALLLGEVIARDGERYDIQLKGSGQTPYSRQGDGRAALGPVLREYVVSEAMAALGVPTTRALAAVLTGDKVLREGVLPGAIFTRVAASHLRVGTFELAAFRGDKTELGALISYALNRHYPDQADEPNAALALLTSVMERQADLIAHWMSLGFIHGVMNTDNCTISGQTIDYGPCAFMDHYDHAQVYSSIDHQGRYAYSNQPPIAHWNMAVLAQALLPHIDDNQERAVEHAQDAVNRFPDLYRQAYEAKMASKLGLRAMPGDDPALLPDLLALMEDEAADFTQTFRALKHAHPSAMAVSALEPMLGAASAGPWHKRWAKHLEDNEATAQEQISLIERNNPAIIPRNHRVEAMIQAALSGDFAPFHALVDALADPYADAPETGEAALLAQPPEANEVVHATFCGT